VAESARKRPWLAALLAFVYPGLGHVYLRAWIRALLWFGLALLSWSIMVPPDIVPAQFSLSGLVELSNQVPLEALLVLTAVIAVNMVDAYWLAKQGNQQREREDEGLSCPNCGRDVDPDLSFCQWCTTELDGPGDANHDGPDHVES